MVHYKLYYFDVRGLGETIRLILHYANQKFEEERYTFENWETYKSRQPYGKVPVLEVDGKPLAETFAIARFLAKQYGLAGKDAWDQAKVDEIADFHKDVSHEVGPYFRAKVGGFGGGDKDQLYKENFLPAVEKNFPIYVRVLKESGSGFMVKSGLTWVDFLIGEYMNTVHHMHPEVLKKYPELEQYRQRVANVSQIKKYIETRKHTVL